MLITCLLHGLISFQELYLHNSEDYYYFCSIKLGPSIHLLLDPMHWFSETERETEKERDGVEGIGSGEEGM